MPLVKDLPLDLRDHTDDGYSRRTGALKLNQTPQRILFRPKLVCEVLADNRDARRAGSVRSEPIELSSALQGESKRPEVICPNDIVNGPHFVRFGCARRAT